MMKKSYYLIFLVILLVFGLFGCASIPTEEGLPTYTLNGQPYVSLISFCNLRDVRWDYDTLTRTVVLTKGAHNVRLMAQDTFVLVDGAGRNLRSPVQLHNGSIFVPLEFKDQVLEMLFKDYYPQRQKITTPLKIKKVIIDAGHGGYDPGAIGKTGLREKSVNLDIAKRIAKILQEEGIAVVMTRATDRFVELPDRVNIANASGGDIFLSIHSNASRTRSLNGFEVYYVSQTVSDSTRALDAARGAAPKLDNAYFASNSSDLRAIVWDMIYSSSRAESIELARYICKSMDKNSDSHILGVKSARFEVLRGAQMPAVLVETGFLSNKEEEKLLKDAYFRQKVAGNIAQGLIDYAQSLSSVEIAQR